MDISRAYQLLTDLVADLDKCHSENGLFSETLRYLNEMGLHLGNISILLPDGRARIAKVSDNFPIKQLNEFAAPFGFSINYEGFTNIVKGTVWQRSFYDGLCLVTDNLELHGEYPNVYRASVSDCVRSFFDNTPGLKMITGDGLIKLLETVDFNHFVLMPFSGGHGKNGSVFIAGSKDNPITDHHFILIQSCAKILGLAYSRLLRDQLINSTMASFKVSDQLLRESERRLNTLMSNLPGMVYRRSNDDNMTLQFASDGMIALTGYSPNNSYGADKIPFSNIIIEEDREKAKATISAAIAEKLPFQIEYRIRKSDGEIRWVLEQGRGIFSPEGILMFLEGFITDIHQRKMAELALRDRDEELFLVTEHFPGPVSHVDRELRYTFANNEYEKWFDQKASDIVGSTIPELLGEKSFNYAKEYVYRALDGEVVSYENPITKKSGYVNTGWVTLVPDRGGDGKPNGFYIFVVDISSRRKVEDALRESEERLRFLFNTSPDAIFVLDKESKITDANQVAIEQYGYSLDELKKMKIYDLRDPSDRSDSRLCDIEPGGTESRYLTVMKRKNGETFNAECVKKLFHWKTGENFMCSIRDISRRGKQ